MMEYTGGRSRYLKEKLTSPSSFLKRIQPRLGSLVSPGGLKNEEFPNLSPPS